MDGITLIKDNCWLVENRARKGPVSRVSELLKLSLNSCIFVQLSLQKDTTPGIPRRSPIQVLTRPVIALTSKIERDGVY